MKIKKLIYIFISNKLPIDNNPSRMILFSYLNLYILQVIFLSDIHNLFKPFRFFSKFIKKFYKQIIKRFYKVLVVL